MSASCKEGCSQSGWGPLLGWGEILSFAPSWSLYGGGGLQLCRVMPEDGNDSLNITACVVNLKGNYIRLSVGYRTGTLLIEADGRTYARASALHSVMIWRYQQSLETVSGSVERSFSCVWYTTITTEQKPKRLAKLIWQQLSVVMGWKVRWQHPTTVLWNVLQPQCWTYECVNCVHSRVHGLCVFVHSLVRQWWWRFPRLCPGGAYDGGSNGRKVHFRLQVMIQLPGFRKNLNVRWEGVAIGYMNIVLCASRGIPWNWTKWALSPIQPALLVWCHCILKLPWLNHYANESTETWCKLIPSSQRISRSGL